MANTLIFKFRLVCTDTIELLSTHQNENNPFGCWRQIIWTNASVFWIFLMVQISICTWQFDPIWRHSFISLIVLLCLSLMVTVCSFTKFFNLVNEHIYAKYNIAFWVGSLYDFFNWVQQGNAIGITLFTHILN